MDLNNKQITYLLAKQMLSDDEQALFLLGHTLRNTFYHTGVEEIEWEHVSFAALTLNPSPKLGRGILSLDSPFSQILSITQKSLEALLVEGFSLSSPTVQIGQRI